MNHATWNTDELAKVLPVLAKVAGSDGQGPRALRFHCPSSGTDVPSTIAAGDEQCAVTVQMHTLDATQGLSLALDAKAVAGVVSKATENVVTLEQVGSSGGKLRSGNDEFRISGKDARKAPSPDDLVIAVDPAALLADHLAFACSTAKKYAAKKDGRRYLNGIRIRVDSSTNSIFCSGTDNTRGAILELTENVNAKGDFDVFLPHAGVDGLLAALKVVLSQSSGEDDDDDEPMAVLALSNDRASLVATVRPFTVRIAAVPYGDVPSTICDAVPDLPLNNGAMVSSKAAKAAIQLASQCASDHVAFEKSDRSTILVCADERGNEARVNLMLESGGPLSSGNDVYDIRHVLAAFASIVDEIAAVGFVNDKRGRNLLVVCGSEEPDDCRVVIAPVAASTAF